jgi:molecular chaperone IbpA
MSKLTMGHAAFHPYHKIGVGFDRMFQELDRLMQIGTNTANGGYPPFNLEKTGDAQYRITMAIAGFTEDEIELLQTENILTVVGVKHVTEDDSEFLYRGIANRSFKREFVLADQVEVVTAALKDGMLVVKLKQLLAAEHTPKKIPLVRG